SLSTRETDVLESVGARAAEALAEKLHATMQVDAHGAGREPRALGDLGAAHALDEPHEERLAVGVGQRADRLQRLARLGAGRLEADDVRLVDRALRLAAAPVARGAAARGLCPPAPARPA